MKTNNEYIYFENTFFAVKCAYKTDESSYWEIIRKINTLPGASGELLEVIVQCLHLTPEIFFLFDIVDFDLCRELSNLGAKRAGYLASSPHGNIQIDGWGEAWSAELIKLHELESIVPFRKNLYVLDEITHSLKTTNDYFLESFFKRDRIYWAVTEANPKWMTNSLSEKTNTGPAGRLEKWGDVTKSRNSVETFTQNSLSKIELEEFLETTLYSRPDGHLNYGTSGGLDEINPYLILRDVTGLIPGVYKVDSKNRLLNFQGSIGDFNLVEKFLFLPENLSGPSVIMLFSLSYEQIYEKYGHRAIRFSLLNLGGALQQLHLSATALGLQYRTIGGFDELQFSRILKIEGREYLACAAILGK